MRTPNPLPCGCRAEHGNAYPNRWPQLHVIHCPLHSAAPDLLAVAKELEESAAYWSEYDVPIGIVYRLRAAIAKAEPPTAGTRS